jgi:hypothetical protein
MVVNPVEKIVREVSDGGDVTRGPKNLKTIAFMVDINGIDKGGGRL